MPGSSSWMPYAPQRVKGPDDDDLLMRVYKHLWNYTSAAIKP
jgi:hypothetical protein